MVAAWIPENLAWLRLDLMVRLVVASLLGGLIGLERELSDKPAGFRTNLLICVGAALLTDLSVIIARAADPLVTQADPGRIAAQIVSGIGFLGAGTIIQARGSVRGLTTAATLWVVAAIGMTVGAGAYVEAVGTTVLVILVLVLLGRIEHYLFRRSLASTIVVETLPEPGIIERVEFLFGEAGFSIEPVQLERSSGRFRASFRVSGPRNRWQRVIRELIEIPGVERITPT